MPSFRRLALLGTALAALSNVAFGYYHWTVFLQRTGPFNPILRKFDLNQLPGGTVQFFIAKQGPAKLVDGDNFTALVSQIRRAGESWNVSGPAIKTQFAGLTTTAYSDAVLGQTTATPAIYVEFNDDLQPGVLAQTVTATYTDLRYLAAKDAPSFAPILGSRVQFANDLSVRAQASYSDDFFLTIVHEFGHALGLQHSMTGGAMSTSLLRGTSKADPITADDIAGLALLYPTQDFLTQTGSLAGHVSVAGRDGNLVSVVALRSDGVAVGAMTQPDGNYRIDGLPPGDYIVYAHALPPVQTDGIDAAAIQAPTDLDSAVFAASTGFHTRFAKDGTGTKNWQEANHFFIQAGKLAPARVNFALDPFAGSAPFNVKTYNYLTSDAAVFNAPLPNGYYHWLIFYGPNLLTAPFQMVPGLQLSAIGSAATLDQAQLQTWSADARFVLIPVRAGTVDHTTPVSLAVTVGDALYVTPRALTVVPSKHPKITSIAPGTDNNGQPVALIAGENLDWTKVLFDGAEALRVVKKEDGTLEALPPAAPGNHSAVVELLGPNGQTSSQVLGLAPFPRYAYPDAGGSSYTLNDGGITVGTDQMIEIRGTGTSFAGGKTAVGFSSGDVAVRQMWVLAPDRLLMNVSVNPKARAGNVALTISTGLKVTTDGIPLQLRPRPANQLSLLAPVLNDATGLAGVPSGGTIVMSSTGFPASDAGWIAKVGGVFRDVRRGTDGRLRLEVPAGLGLGPSLIEMLMPTGQTVPPILFQVDAAPPTLQSITKIAAPDSTTVYSLDRIALKVAGLGSGEWIDPATLEVRVAGVLQTVETTRWDADASAYIIEFTLTDTVPVGDGLSVTVRTGTRISPAGVLNLAVRPAGV